MTKDEYIAKRQEINDERDKQALRLDIDYVMQFKQADIGDIIACKDNERIIIVDEIEPVKYSQSSPPEITYRGEQLNRALKPYKKPKRMLIWGSSFGKVLVKGGDNEG